MRGDDPRLLVPQSAFNQAFLPHLQARERVQIYFGGAGSGKSAFLASRVALDALCGRNTLVARKVAHTLKSSCFAEVSKAIRRLGLGGFFKANASDLTVTCPRNGAQILFTGLQDVDKVKSLSPARGALTDIWVEEATEASQKDIKQLEKRLRGPSPHPKRLTLSFNPVSRQHWLYRAYFPGVPEGQAVFRGNGLLVMHSSYRDNRFLTDDDIRALEGEKDPYFREVYTLGSWGQAGGAILTNWRVAPILPGEVREPLRLGLDFGYARDPSAAIKVSFDAGRKRVLVLDEMYARGWHNARLAEKLRDFSEGSPVTCDSAEPRSIAELRRLGILALPARKGPGSLNHGLQWLSQHEIIVAPHCVNLQEELANYRWRQGPGGEMLPTPEGEDHLIDALRYALEGDNQSRAAKGMSRFVP